MNLGPFLTTLLQFIKSICLCTALFRSHHNISVELIFPQICGPMQQLNFFFFSQSVVVLLLASYIRPNFGHITGSSSSQTNGRTFHREFIVDPRTERSPGQIIMPPLLFLTVGMRCCVWFSPNVMPCIMAKHSVQMALLGVFISRFVQLQPHGPKPFCHVL